MTIEDKVNSYLVEETGLPTDLTDGMDEFILDGMMSRWKSIVTKIRGKNYEGTMIKHLKSRGIIKNNITNLDDLSTREKRAMVKMMVLQVLDES